MSADIVNAVPSAMLPESLSRAFVHEGKRAGSRQNAIRYHSSMTPANARAPLTEDEYWRIFHLIRGDVEAAIKSNHAYLTVNNLVVAEREIYEKVNKFPDFWKLNAFALQTTFFIVFGRLFDMRPDSHSVQKLVDATIENPVFFSKAALRERKRQSSNISGPDPEWLVDYVNNAWEPTTADLEPLRTALIPHYQKFKTIYKPIRHKVYAHKSMEDDKAIADLFGRTLIGDVADILRFLHTMLWAITEMAWNAKPPDLADFRDYGAYVNGHNEKTERFIRQLP
jgi:hypothetical protein